MFYPIKLVRQLVKIDKNNKPMEKVEPTYPEIEVPKMKGKKFGKTKQKQMFEITPESIRWDVKVEVSTDLNAPTIAEVEKEQKMDFYRRAWEVWQTYAADPTLEQIIPKKKAIMDLAKLNHIETEQADDAEVSEMKKDLYKELKTAMEWQRTPEEAPNPEMLWQPNAEIAQEGQPAPVPNAPNIIR